MGLQQAVVTGPDLPVPVVVPAGWARAGLVERVGRDRQGREELLQGWWDDAAAAWIETKLARSGSEHTQRAYESSVRTFFEFCQVRPWEVGGVQVIAWQQAMRGKGLSEATVNLRLAALSSFYAFCCYRYVVTDPATGREIPLMEHNPVARVERAKVSPYEKSVYLSVDEVRALLRSIPRNTVVGLRDYALIVTYLYTGRRSSEVRTLRWGDIRQEGGRVWYDWKGKGKKRTDELPLPAYNAIVAYLEAAGRLEGMGEEDFIFTALSGVATRLPGVEEVGSRPLSSSFVNRVVKKGARRAGLKWKRIHTHTLRHTAAMLRYDLSGDVKKLKDFLNHSSLATTQIYLDHNEKRTDTLWAQVEALIGTG